MVMMREQRDLSRLLYPYSRVHRSGYQGVEFPGDTPDSGHSPALDTIREMMKPKRDGKSIISRSKGHRPTIEGGRNVLERLVPRKDPHALKKNRVIGRLGPVFGFLKLRHCLASL